ncbi:preprotein translocase subunit SecA [Rhabdochlamydiaceae symbiont of Dictyostelium giganteum]|uniref:preprotein translocase subunit SecA n=1 Tax=Rhabdochlamydiaceae symbiont of Dictyostelium giganteum TaxID=3342349 RepID=UPI00384F7007
MLTIFRYLFGTQQTRMLSRYQKLVKEVNSQEKKLQSLTDDQLKAKTAEFRQRLKDGAPLDDLLPEAYAVVKEACRRLCGIEMHVSGYDQKWDMIPYDVQILGGIALHHGSIAEMQTGEGKTLTAAMPLYLNALTGKPVHLVTVNDYLAQRDCEWIGSVFRWLGMTVKSLTNATPQSLRKEVYAADIVYGTASEFGFDYLRDNSMAQQASDQCQRGHYFTIIDEVDSVLIDEARTPLIISGPVASSRQMYDVLEPPVSELIRFQRDLCNKLATQAKKTVDQLDFLKEKEVKLSKEDEASAKAAFRKLWLVGKGMPHNKILKRLKEDPKVRSFVDEWDIYYYGEQNKEERIEALSELYITVDERGNEYELTDKGMHLWVEMKQSANDFTMLDLGEAYALIDQNTALTDDEKLSQKVNLREEDALRKEKAHNLRQLLRAYLLMEKDVDYIIQDGKIVIIDENTGRPQPGRRFSDGLHQSIEAKEGVEIQGETQTYATITLQNYFRLYEKLAGMTGTAMTEASEFKEIYKLDVLSIPTHKPSRRFDFDDEVYMTEREKYLALLQEIQKVHREGRPILIGTESVDISEKISRILKQNKLEHTVLNAKNHAKEAEVIALAGEKGAIMVATNMAGRGTDIKLSPDISALGGLHVIGTTRHQSRRIDRQLRGRCARQGDPGSSKFFISFEDSLLRLFTSPRVATFLHKFRPPEGEPISAKVLNRSIETAQKRVEQRNYQMRKHTLEYDDVMNKQRAELYAFRNDVLHTTDILSLAEEVLEGLSMQKVARFLGTDKQASMQGLESLTNWLTTNFPVTFDLQVEAPLEVEKRVTEQVIGAFRLKMEQERKKIDNIEALVQGKMNPYSSDILVDIVRNILIRSIDKKWQEHLLMIDYLKSEVHLRVVGQKDPLMEFKHEAFELFNHLSETLKEEIAHALFKFQMVLPEIKSSKKVPLEDSSFQAPFRVNLSLMPEIES